ncbi:primosomal protein N' [bacterium]|nr:primosomal protein N' [bacterium]
MENKFAEVVVPLPIQHAFSYAIPTTLAGLIQIGMRVLVPFGKRTLTGYVVNMSPTSSYQKVRPLTDVLDKAPAFSTEILELAAWISDYYMCGLGEVLKAALPAGISLESERIISMIPSPDAAAHVSSRATIQQKILQSLAAQDHQSIKQLQRKLNQRGLHSAIFQLNTRGLIKINSRLTSALVKKKIGFFVKINLDNFSENDISEHISLLQKSAPKQARCLDFLLSSKDTISRPELLKTTSIASSSLTALQNKGLVTIFQQEIIRAPQSALVSGPPPDIVLNSWQQKALDQVTEALLEKRFQSFLLHGVTGSGKTQVYIDALKVAVNQGRGGIVLVPEISLTPQTVSRFQANFPGQIAVLHSRMSPGERYDSWRKLKDGHFRIAVGARSAIFAPIENLGLIVVDEEHEGSYKQFETNPLYHARDVAVIRGLKNQAAVLLGSATPAIESYFNAKNGKYTLLELPSRIDNIPMPAVRVIDMTREHRVYGYDKTQIFSIPLKRKIAEKLEKKEQIILLQNRRGHSPHVHCEKCGHVEECGNCNITLTYHRRGNVLRCHYCGFTKPIPQKCPECGDSEIIFKGIGTQRVEEELHQIFPEARIIRMDFDTTSGKTDHDRIITEFGKGNYDILLGTQMVAKGLDFHRVTLVGVISADTGLFQPDFRASERTFQLLTQVAGRPGRKNMQGEVIIQTYSPDRACLILASHHDFIGFYQQELAGRKELGYPPFGRLVSILFRGTDEDEVIQAARFFSQQLHMLKCPFTILGPAPSPISRIQRQFRWQLVLKASKKQAPNGTQLRHFVDLARTHFNKKHHGKQIHISVDVDPVSMF